jgi:hypothetical protein
MSGNVPPTCGSFQIVGPVRREGFHLRRSLAQLYPLKLMLRDLAKRLPHPLLMRLHHRYQRSTQSALARGLAERTGLPLLETLDLSKVKSSDTVFVLGSGSSINEIPDQRWGIIGCHDTIALNFWPVHRFIPKIHLFENINAADDIDVQHFKLSLEAFQSLIRRRGNEYRNVTKIVSELQPLDKKQLVLEIPEVFRPNLYIGHSAGVVARSESEFIAGLRYLERQGIFAPGKYIAWHFKYGGSVIAAMSLAVRMNYRRIVLCGVDLGMAEYFYQDPTLYPESSSWEFAPRGAIHPTTRKLQWLLPSQNAIYCFKQHVLDPASIELYVENRSSTLFQRVPEAPPQLFEPLGWSPKVRHEFSNG